MKRIKRVNRKFYKEFIYEWERRVIKKSKSHLLCINLWSRKLGGGGIIESGERNKRRLKEEKTLIRDYKEIR